jgi:predicted signal transduction protein with EAL and GGDEF domain
VAISWWAALEPHLVLALRLCLCFVSIRFNWELALAIENTVLRSLSAMLSSPSVLCSYTERLTYELHHGHRDLLTGIYNRRMLEERLQQGLAAARRSGTRWRCCYSISITSKSSMTASGMPAAYGLKTLAQVVKAQLRAYDILALRRGFW